MSLRPAPVITDEIREAARIDAERQGLPATITDPPALAVIASVLRAPVPEAVAA